MPRVLVKYLGTIRDKVEKGEEKYELVDGSTLCELAGKIEESHALSLLDQAVMVTLNGQGIRQLPNGLETSLKEGDVVLLFPPVSGG